MMKNRLSLWSGGRDVVVIASVACPEYPASGLRGFLCFAALRLIGVTVAISFGFVSQYSAHALIKRARFRTVAALIGLLPCRCQRCAQGPFRTVRAGSSFVLLPNHGTLTGNRAG